MPLAEFEAFASEPLAFPVGGKLYTLAPIGIRAGMRLAGIVAGRDKSIENEPAEELWKIVLGDVWDQMLEDDCPAEAVARAGMAALADHQYGRAVAEAMWESGDSPEALAARVAASKSTRSTGGANATRSRASTKATTSPKVSRRSAK